MLYVINYADGFPYESYRKINTRTAYRFGKADKVIEYSRKDIPKEYIDSHKDIFSYKRGAGLWLWKPYIIFDALKKIKENDWLFYSDSGVTIINDLNLLVQCAEANSRDVLVFELPLLNRQYTKRECYVLLQIEDGFENQVLGTMLLLRRTDYSLRFVEEWLRLCENVELLSPERFHLDIDEWEDYNSHREDQSILSLLKIKWNLLTFRDPSDYGEMPFMYASAESKYTPKTFSNSTYPTIVLCNRRIKPFYYWIIYIIKHILNTLGIYYTEKNILKKRRIKKYEIFNI